MNNIQKKTLVPKVSINDKFEEGELFYSFVAKIRDIDNNQAEKEQLKVKINKSILSIEEKNMLLGYL